MNKQNYREQARLHRDRLDFDASVFESIIDVFFESFSLPKDKIIAAYWPVGKEFDCRFLLDELSKRGYQCALPSVQKESRVMAFKPWSADTKMTKGAFGIFEPDDTKELIPDIIIAPLLAYDQKGYRLGQGGGYYDATIAHLRQSQDVTFIGIGHAEQAVLFKLPREDHDIPLDYMLTPNGLIDFKGSGV